MNLGKRLAAGGNDRSAAFVKAWAIIKAGTVELPVRGVSFENRQEALKRLAGYNPADVRTFTMPEPDNQFDPAAIAVMVMVQGGRGVYRLGYLPKGQTAIATVFKHASLKILNGDIRGARIALSA